MSVKKRSINEIRQTKDSIYRSPYQNIASKNEEVFNKYINIMLDENNASMISLKNFAKFLSKNGYIISKE